MVLKKVLMKAKKRGDLGHHQNATKKQKKGKGIPKKNGKGEGRQMPSACSLTLLGVKWKVPEIRGKWGGGGSKMAGTCKTSKSKEGGGRRQQPTKNREKK